MAQYTNTELVDLISGCTSFDNKIKSQLIQRIRESKKYGLVWEDSPEDAWDILKTKVPVLHEVKEKRIVGDNPSNPNHILIEGDNLHALEALLYTHEGKVDVIYIDPPYNTGATAWRYNNKFVDDNDTFKHSHWLSWINRRIRIAKRLLSETGIIVVTIDDYEIAQLRLLMDDIFGIENYLGTIVIRNNPSGRSTVRGLSVNHEYGLLYSKSELSALGHMPHNDDQRSRYGEKDETGYYEWENFRKNGTDSDRKDRPKQFFPIALNKQTGGLRIPEVEWNDERREYDILELISPDETVLWPCTPDGTEKVWKYGIERTRTIISDILVKKTARGIELYRKKYLNVEGSLPRTWWDKPEYSARDNGTRTLTNIFGPTKVFDFPKAPEAVKDCLIAANLPKDGIVLDFFAGSGTTLHATMLLNAQDGGSRQCILVTNNENRICEEVTYVRNKRVIEGYDMPNGQHIDGLLNNNLFYYRVDFCDRSKTHQAKRTLFFNLTDIVAVKEQAYTEVPSFGSLNLTGRTQLLKCLTSANRDILLMADTRAIPFVLEEIRKRKQTEKPVSIYAFADGSYPYTSEFSDVIRDVQLIAMPFSYNQALRMSLPIEEEESIDNAELTQEEIDGILSAEE